MSCSSASGPGRPWPASRTTPGGRTWTRAPSRSAAFWPASATTGRAASRAAGRGAWSARTSTVPSSRAIRGSPTGSSPKPPRTNWASRPPSSRSTTSSSCRRTASPPSAPARAAAALGGLAASRYGPVPPERAGGARRFAPNHSSAGELGDVLVGQLELWRGEDRIDLVRAAEADDRAVDRRVAERPGDRDGPRRRLRAARRPLRRAPRSRSSAGRGSADRACASRRPAASRPARASCCPSGARPHRRVDDHADPLASAERAGSRRSTSRAIERVLRLQRLDRRDRLRPPKLRDVEVETPMWRTSPPPSPRRGSSTPPRSPRPGSASGSGRGRSRPTPSRSRLASSSRRSESRRRLWIVVRSGPLGLARLREHVRALGGSVERAPDDLLGVAEPVLRGGVDPVDARARARGGSRRSSRRRPARPSPSPSPRRRSPTRRSRRG